MQVRLENITKTFVGKGRSVTAVDNMNITIQSGKLVGFLGPSGCGKSTSLFMIAGIYPLTSGKIFFDDLDVTSLAPEKRGVGIVFQNYALYPHISVRDNIAFPLVNSKAMKHALKSELIANNQRSAQNLSFKELVAERVANAAKLVEISDYLDRKPAELSGGQQQRVAIARAIVKRPSLLLLDEPLSNLDARLRLQTREEIKRIQQETGITTIFVTHDQEESLTICDEIVIMKNGVLQQHGAPQAVYDNPKNQFVAEFLGTPPINLIDGEIRDGMLYLSGTPWKALPQPIANKSVKVGIRAENLHITPGDEPETFGAAVLALTKLGGAITMDVALADGQKLRLFEDSSRSHVVGARLNLAVRTDATILFDGEGGKLLQW